MVFVGSREWCIEGWGSGVLKVGGVVYRRLGEWCIEGWGSGVLKAGEVVY